MQYQEITIIDASDPNNKKAVANTVVDKTNAKNFMYEHIDGEDILMATLKQKKRTQLAMIDPKTTITKPPPSSTISKASTLIPIPHAGDQVSKPVTTPQDVMQQRALKGLEVFLWITMMKKRHGSNYPLRSMENLNEWKCISSQMLG